MLLEITRSCHCILQTLYISSCRWKPASRLFWIRSRVIVLLNDISIKIRLDSGVRRNDDTTAPSPLKCLSRCSPITPP